MGIGARQMKLIAFTGLPRSGKDTAAGYLIDRHGFQRVQFSEPLKQAAAILLGRPLSQMHGYQDFDRELIMPEWGFSIRYFLQRLGTEVMRENFGADFWVKLMRNRLKDAAGDFVITDLRFENEAAMVRDLGGTVVQVWRPGVKGSSHVSDAGVIADVTVHNDDTLPWLYRQLEIVLRDAYTTRKSAAE